jgi:hypothetical protein
MDWVGGKVTAAASVLYSNENSVTSLFSICICMKSVMFTQQKLISKQNSIWYKNFCPRTKKMSLDRPLSTRPTRPFQLDLPFSQLRWGWHYKIFCNFLRMLTKIAIFRMDFSFKFETMKSMIFVKIGL